MSTENPIGNTITVDAYKSVHTRSLRFATPSKNTFDKTRFLKNNNIFKRNFITVIILKLNHKKSNILSIRRRKGPDVVP